jgi:hypothetical protein
MSRQRVAVPGINAQEFTSFSFGRISGAMRRKPGFPLQFLGFTAGKASGISASIPCAAFGRAAILLRKIATRNPY